MTSYILFHSYPLTTYILIVGRFAVEILVRPISVVSLRRFGVSFQAERVNLSERSQISDPSPHAGIRCWAPTKTPIL